MTPYALKLLARRDEREAAKVVLTPFVDSSKQAIKTFRLWEAGFNAFEKGFPITSCNRHKQARQGWRAAAKCREWLETHEFDRVDLQSIVEKIAFTYDV